MIINNYCTKYNMVLAHKTGKITATLKKNKLHLKKGESHCRQDT